MSQAIFKSSINIVFGVREPKPITGAPHGKWRLRMRKNAIAKLFVKTADGIRSFILEDKGYSWFANPRFEQGRNLRH